MTARLHTCYSPVRRSPAEVSKLTSPLPLDLHVLSLSLAFILSQDQTLRCCLSYFFFFLISKRNKTNNFVLSVLCRCGASFKAPQVSGWLIDFFPLVELTSGIFSFKNDSCTVFLSIVILSMFSCRFAFRRRFLSKAVQSYALFIYHASLLKLFFEQKCSIFSLKYTYLSEKPTY